MPKIESTHNTNAEVPEAPKQILYTLDQVAAVLGVKPDTLQRKMSKPNFGLKVTHNVTGASKGKRISAEHFEAWLEGRRLAADLPSFATPTGEAKAS